MAAKLCRAPVARRARRAVLAAAALFAGSQLAFGLAAEEYPRLRDPAYGDKLVKLRRRFDARPAAARVVMLGSSRTGMAFHAANVEGDGRAVAFNFGIPAAGPVTQLVYLQRLLDDGVTPDLLLVEVLPSLLSKEADGRPRERHFLAAERLTASECDTVARLGFPADDVRGTWARTVTTPAYWLRFPTLSKLVPSALPWQHRNDWSRGADADGLSRTPDQTENADRRERATAQARLEYEPVLRDFTPGGPAFDALRELLTLAETHGIPTRLVLMPEAEEFRGYLPDAGYQRLLDALRELPAPLVNAREWLPNAAFVDGHHTFVAGADLFTAHLTREVITPWLDAKAGR